VAALRSPFTDEEVSAVSALNPDVAVIHAQQADRRGNVGMWGITGVQREVALASKRVVVTVEELVDELDLRGPNGSILPSWTVHAVAPVPRGSHPSYSMGYTNRDNAFYTKWDLISRDRETFEKWMETFVTGPDDFNAYLKALDAGVLTSMVDDA
jgi:glutaconate CoA-transferase subunit A